MAFVGSLTSAVIGAICLLAANAVGGASSDPWMAMLLWLGYINLTLAVFNLVPGYPLDGGRVTRAIIWWKTGDADRSTRAAAKAGQAVALAFIAFGIFRFFGGAGIGGKTRLEEKLQSELNHPGRCLHADNLPEGGTAGVIVRNIKLRVLESVEKFGSEPSRGPTKSTDCSRFLVQAQIRRTGPHGCTGRSLKNVFQGELYDARSHHLGAD